MALIDCLFYSKILGLSTSMSVILPDPVASRSKCRKIDRHTKYPTLYLLHGLSDDHTIWQRRTSIERYVEGLNLAVVMPAVHRSFYTDMATGHRYWTFISEEVPAMARHFFPLSDLRDDNYVAGLSMGGYGAFKLALTNPERYSAAASLSGVLDIDNFVKAKEAAGEKEFTHIFGKADRLSKSPNDLLHLARRIVKQNGMRPALYQWCGTEDFLFEDNLRFRDQMKALHLPVKYEEGPGGHSWSCWDAQIQRVLAWLPKAHRSTESRR